MEKQHIEVNDEEFEAEVADTIYTRAKGLSFRTQGKMLFKFSRDTNGKIDMVFLSKPLYLYFLNSDKEVIDIQKAEPWGFNPKTWKLYSPDRPYRYLLESFEKLDVEEGDVFEFRQ